MQVKDLHLPVAYHPTMDVVDASKLTAYMDCPRQFYYRYVLGWVPDKKSNHLVFGEAWHSALEHLLLAYKERQELTTDDIKAAYEQFLLIYRKDYPEESDIEFEPKIPANALEGLIEFASTYRFRDRETLYTEIAGTVPLTEDKKMHFRIDSVIKTEGKIIVQDFKTASRFTNQWAEQWILSPQIGLYTHVAFCLYEPSEVMGAEVLGTCFYKTKPHAKFQVVPVRRSPDLMAVWLQNTLGYLYRMEDDYRRLQEDKPEARLQRSFPLNPTACTKYFGCPYQPFCSAWANPLQHIEEPPVGFKIDRWNPADHVSPNAEKVDL